MISESLPLNTSDAIISIYHNVTEENSTQQTTLETETSLSFLDISKIIISVLGTIVNLATVITLFKHGKGFSTKSKLLLQHQVSEFYHYVFKINLIRR